MSNSLDEFKRILKVSDSSHIDTLSNSIYNKAMFLRDSSEYRNFTEQFILYIGKEIEKEFPGTSIELKARIKSKNSISKKSKKNAQKHLENPEFTDYTLYDIYGAKLVILDVSDNFTSSHVSIDGFLEKRRKAREYLQKAYENSAKLLDEKCSNSSNNKIITDLNQEILRLNTVIYREVDTECQRTVSREICSFIINNPDIADKFGISNLKERFRRYNLKNEYIAEHLTFSSSKLPGWYMEIQFKSFYDYEIARTGEAAHINRTGKEISISNNLLENTVDNDIPEYIVYSNGSLYIPSREECKLHTVLPAFYQKKSASNPDKSILSDYIDRTTIEPGLFKKQPIDKNTDIER